MNFLNDITVNNNITAVGTIQSANLTVTGLSTGAYTSIITENAGIFYKRDLSLSLLPSGTEGQMLYNNAGTWTATSGMFWDDTNNRLGVGLTSSLNGRLSVRGVGTSSSTYGLDVEDSAGTPVLRVRDDGLLMVRQRAPDATYGNELVTNGNFTSDLSGWTVGGADWTWVSGAASHAATGANTLTQLTVTNGAHYRVSFTIAKTSGTSLTVAFGGVTLVTHTSGTTTYTFDVLTVSTTGFVITPTSDFVGTIDTVSAKLYTVANNPVITVVSTDGTSLMTQLRGSVTSTSMFFGANAGRFADAASVGNVTLGNATAQSMYYGLYNTIVGSGAGQNLNNATRCTYLGYGAGQSSTAAEWNNALGYQTLFTNTTGTFNTAVGPQSMYYNVTGTFNTALGFRALFNNLSSHNVGVGSSAGYSLATSGAYNSFVGADSGYFVSSGTLNAAIGYRSFYNPNAASSYNVVVGAYALYGTTNACNNNTVVGYYAGYATTTGSNNILIGYNTAANLTTGSTNVIIGYNLSAQSISGTGQLSIANALFGTGNTGAGTTVSTGGLGVYVTSPTARLHLPAGAAGASQAPLKFTSGTNLSTAEAGAMEWNGTNLYITQTSGPTRKTIAYFDAVWNSTNDGAGSGLDADLLDGQHGSYYLDTSAGSQTKTGNLTLSGRVSITGELTDPSGCGKVHSGNVEKYYQCSQKLQGINYTGNSTTLEIEVVTSAAGSYGGPMSRTVWRICTRGSVSVLRFDEHGGVNNCALRIVEDTTVADTTATRYFIGVTMGNAATFNMGYVRARYLESDAGSRWVTIAEMATATPTTQGGSALTYSSGWVVNNVSYTLLSHTETIMNLKAGQLTTTVTTGTAPFVVASTTVSTNLNADLLDGQHGSYYLDTSSTAQTKTGQLTLNNDADGVMSITASTANSACLLYGNVGGTGKVRLQKDGEIRALSLAIYSGTNVNSGGVVASISNAGAITAASFSGPLTGNVTGNCTGSSGSCTGNSASATYASNVTVAAASGTANYLAMYTANTGNIPTYASTACVWNDTTSTLTVPNLTVSTTLTATVSNATTATNANNIAITNDTTTNATMYPVWVTANTGNLPLKVTSTKLGYNPSTGTLSLTGAISVSGGNVSVSGAQVSVAGGNSGFLIGRRDTSAAVWQWYSSAGSLELYDHVGAANKLVWTQAGTLTFSSTSTVFSGTSGITVSGGASTLKASALGSAATYFAVFNGDPSTSGTALVTRTATQVRSDISAATSGAVTASGLTMTTARMLGRTTAATGAIEEITIGAGLTLSATSLVTSGAYTACGHTMSTARLLGRTTASSGAAEEISLANGTNCSATLATGVLTIAISATPTFTDCTVTGRLNLPTSQPGSPVNGSCYWDGATNKFWVYSSTYGWKSVTLT